MLIPRVAEVKFSFQTLFRKKKNKERGRKNRKKRKRRDLSLLIYVPEGQVLLPILGQDSGVLLQLAKRV